MLFFSEVTAFQSWQSLIRYGTDDLKNNDASSISALLKFGLKIDACPGRLNQVNLFIKRIGVFFGQCSEICGVNHGFMPIVIVSLPTLQFHHYIMTKLELN